MVFRRGMIAVGFYVYFKNVINMKIKYNIVFNLRYKHKNERMDGALRAVPAPHSGLKIRSGTAMLMQLRLNDDCTNAGPIMEKHYLGLGSVFDHFRIRWFLFSLGIMQGEIPILLT